MPLILASVVLCVLVALTVRSRRQARRRILAGSAEGAMPPGAASDPRRAANEARATIDAMNGRGTL